jgi:mannose-6-phosphate isomerase-like protein (cupin superfamily)
VGGKDGVQVFEREEGELIDFRGTQLWRKVTSDDTGGRWAFDESSNGPGFHNTPHTHTEPEGFYVLEGEYTFYTGGEPRKVGPHSFVFIPPGTRHGFVAGPDGREAAVPVAGGLRRLFLGDEGSVPATRPEPCHAQRGGAPARDDESSDPFRVRAVAFELEPMACTPGMSPSAGRQSASSWTARGARSHRGDHLGW